MSPLKTSLLAGLVSVGLTAASFHHFHTKKSREAEYLRDQNNQLRYEAYETHRNRQSPPVVGSDAAGRGAETPAAPASPTAQKPAENYRNEGQSTPAAALQTLAWACDRGDTETLAKLILFDPSASAKATDYLAAIPASAPARWKSPDEFAATQLAFSGMVSPFPNAEVLAACRFESTNETQTEFRLPGTRRDHTQFQKVGDLWKVVITESMIDHFIKALSELESAKSAQAQ